MSAGTPRPEDALSGESGIVTGPRKRARALLADALDDAAAWLTLKPPGLRRAARRHSAQVAPALVLAIYGASQAGSMMRTIEELGSARRQVRFTLGALDEATPALRAHTLLDGMRGHGKFENLNALLERVDTGGAEWVIVVDDDVGVPRGFLDSFLFLAERFGLQLAQPALRRASHTAWAVCRRERWSVVRVTRMVEIGPVTAFHRSVAGELLPFPPLRMGWGLDAHWGALAIERGWRLGIVDATPVRHEARPPASGYDRREAVAELKGFLADRPHIDRNTALSVLERHRGWA